MAAREDPDFQHDLHGGGNTQLQQAREARPIRRQRDAKQSGAPHAIVVECAGDEHARHINAGGEGGPGGPVSTHGAETQMTIDQDPVSKKVDGIGGDLREHHRLDQADALQIPAEGEVQHERQHAPIQNAQIGGSLRKDGGVHSEARHGGGHGGVEEHQSRHEDGAKVEAAPQGAMTIGHPPGAIGLGDHGIETQQEAFAENGEGEEQNAAQADRADGGGAIRQAADHDGIDDAHGHPAEFGDDQRPGERQQRPPFAADVPERRHLFSITQQRLRA